MSANNTLSRALFAEYSIGFFETIRSVSQPRDLRTIYFKNSIFTNNHLVLSSVLPTVIFVFDVFSPNKSLIEEETKTDYDSFAISVSR